MHYAFLYSMKILSDTITIMQIIPILQIINLEAESDSFLGIPSSKADTIFSIKTRYHSSKFKSIFDIHPLLVS